jgi:hypothetical protein
MPVARLRDPERENEVVFTTRISRAMGALQSALDVGGRGRELFVLATCSLKFAKTGSAATLSQQ